MKIYISSSCENREAVKTLRRILINDGHEITFDWTIHEDAPESPAQATQWAMEDVTGVLKADLILFIAPGRRGAHVELGVGIYTRKPIFLLGKYEDNIFYHYPNVRRFEDLFEMLEAIEEMQRSLS